MTTLHSSSIDWIMWRICHHSHIATCIRLEVTCRRLEVRREKSVRRETQPKEKSQICMPSYGKISHFRICHCFEIVLTLFWCQIEKQSVWGKKMRLTYFFVLRPNSCAKARLSYSNRLMMQIICTKKDHEFSSAYLLW